MDDRLEIISIANKLFGESGWSFSISDVCVDYIDENKGSLSAGASAVVRVQRSGGAFREEIGYGVFVGSDKGEVISKAKKNAVTDGLKGAVISFGGEIAKTFNSVTPKKVVTENQRTNLSNLGNAVPNSIVRTDSCHGPSTSKVSVADQAKSGNYTSAPIKPSATSNSSTALKASPVPARVAPLPRVTSPVAAPLSKHSTAGGPQLSDEELAKIERKKIALQLQEQFRKKHLQGQAPDQKAQEAHEHKFVPQQSRAPLKEQRPNQHSTGSDANLGEGDDDVLLSTQDMEAMLAMAANPNLSSNTSRRSPMLSSPSLARPVDSKHPTRSVIGQKRPDLSTYTFNPDKKAREK